MKKTTADLNPGGAKAVNCAAAFCACVLIISAVLIFMPVNGEEQIYNNIIRLHVLANSDSRNDQDLKLKVRDYILEDVAELTRYSADSHEAAEKIRAELENIENKTREFIRSQGYNYNISAVLSREVYPARIYADESGDYIFPSGDYNSLRIIIGEAQGENWWCVLFPPLCLSGVMIEEELAVAGYTSEQINILIKDNGAKYEIRFKILEILNAIFR
jgi:stage II sporulation protein R